MAKNKIEIRTFLDKNRNIVNILWMIDEEDVYPFLNTFMALNPKMQEYVFANDNELFDYK